MNLRSNAPLLVFAWGLACFAASPSNAAAAQPGACSATAQDALQACHHDTEDNYWISLGNCNNLKDASARATCLEDAAEERREGRQLCREQLAGRLEVCGDLGESRYDPRIDPALFVDPKDIGKSVAPNPYLLLTRGRELTYRNGDERIKVSVTKDTVVILGVQCAVIHDIATGPGGVVIEDTIDWLAQDVYGNIWYFGEISQQFENGELASLEGSWKAGVDFAKPGLAMKAAPAVGDVYRQEFSLGNAEDLGKVLSLNASVHAPAGSCSHTCLLTEDFTPIEPDTIEHKYYAPGVGLLLDLDTVTGERETLIHIKE